jgi:hypothetical protein
MPAKDWDRHSKKGRANVSLDPHRPDPRRDLVRGMPLTPAGQDLAVGSNDQVLETTPDRSGLNRVDGTSRRVEQLTRAPPYCTYGHTALQKAIAGNRC